VATLGNVEPELAKRVEWMIDLSQGRFWVSSGWRSSALQTELYRLHQADPKHYPSAFPPGQPKHENNPADAVDVACQPEDAKLRASLAIHCGLYTPYGKKEPWHMELAPGRLPLPNEEDEVDKTTDACMAPSRRGAWVLDRDGAVRAYNFDDRDPVPHFGSMHDYLNERDVPGRYFVAIEPVGVTDGEGYWILSNDGGRFKFVPKR
jgi:hypothetical protein